MNMAELHPSESIPKYFNTKTIVVIVTEKVHCFLFLSLELHAKMA